MERNNQLLKQVDFWVGIPLLYCLSLFKRKITTPPAQIKTIGTFAFAAIGDSILSSSLLPGLRNKYPVARIIVFASQANASIYTLIAGYDELVILPITEPAKALQTLRKYSLDILIDTSQWTKLSALYSLLLKARFKIGFWTKGQYRHFSYDVVVDHLDSIHEIENFQNLLKPLNITGFNKAALNFERIAQQDLNASEVKRMKPYIVFHPWASGTRSELREWPTSYWVKLAKKILAKNFNIVITGSDQNQPDAFNFEKLIKANDDRIKVIAGDASLLQTAKVIQDAIAVISVNTGIAHLSDHLGVPTIALNGPTNSRRWGLVNSNSRNIDISKQDGGGFLNLGFEYSKNSLYLMDKIGVDQVDKALGELIDSRI